MMTYQSKGVLLTLAIIGCVMARSGNAAATRFEVQLDAITTNPPISRDGKLLVLGTVDGENHDAGFDCRFEQNGAYLGIIGAPAMND